MYEHEQGSMGRNTGYGLARGHSSLKQRLGDALWTLTISAGGILLAVAVTYAAMKLNVRLGESNGTTSSPTSLVQ